jgi:curved DNA-binding protein CbpA
MAKKTPDLYAVLGVDRAASAAEVHRAYRKAAKQAHPDAPSGSDSRFALVKLADDVLTNPQRRQVYDATGEADETKPDNERAEAMNCIAAALEACLGECRRSNNDPRRIDLAASMRVWIGKEITEMNHHLTDIKDEIRRTKDLPERFDGDVMASIFAGRNAVFQQKVIHLEKNKKSALDALEILKPTKYRADPPPPRDPYNDMMRRMGATSIF